MVFGEDGALFQRRAITRLQELMSHDSLDNHVSEATGGGEAALQISVDVRA